MILLLAMGDNLNFDFDGTKKTVVIIAGTTGTTVNITVTNDTIVEGDETFTMSLTVPTSLQPGIVAGTLNSATGIIVDTTSKWWRNIFLVANVLYCYRNQSKV